MRNVTVQEALELALQHHQAGRLAKAEEIYRQLLAAQPNHADAMHMLGVIAHQSGRQDMAVQWIRRAIVLMPGNPAAHSNLGEAYRALGRLDEAVASYRRALEFKPDDAVAHYNFGNTLQDMGRLDDAVAAYRRVLEIKPDYADAHHNLGIALARQGRIEEATEEYCRTLHFAPAHADACNNLGIAFFAQGRFEDAVVAYRLAIELTPDQPEAYNNLGNSLRELGELEEAVTVYRRALQLSPDSTEAHANLGNALREQGRLDDAFTEYRRALELQPNRADTHNDLGIALLGAGRLDDAQAALRRAIQLDADLPETRINLGNVLKERGELAEAIAAFRRALQLQPHNAAAHSNLIYTLHFDPDADEKAIAGEQARWERQFGQPVGRLIQPHANDRHPERKLRIGYVSPDFRDHVTGRYLRPLFNKHDRENFEIICYAGVVRPDGLTKEFRELASQWRSTNGVSDEALAEVIRRDGVDILVDLSQHMAGNRLTMFARQPAPVQVSFAGYPEGTGVEAIEYRISDSHLESQKSRTEQVHCLDSFWCYDPCGVNVEVNELPARKNGWVTFGSLNNFCKINDKVLNAWAKVLGTVPDSRLVMLSARGSHRQRSLAVLARAGVEARRVDFVELRPRKEYLELYHRPDIALDPFPYNGHTTSLDALWMGVPVVSLAGERAVSRGGLSQLANLGLRELVASSEEEYADIATRLAHDLPRLAELRQTLRSRMEASTLMDAERFTRSIEAAYRVMWQRWCGGEK